MKNLRNQKSNLVFLTKCTGLSLPTWQIIGVALVILAGFAGVFSPMATVHAIDPSDTSTEATEDNPYDEGTASYYEWQWDTYGGGGTTYASSGCSQYTPDFDNNKDFWIQCQMDWYEYGSTPSTPPDSAEGSLSYYRWFWDNGMAEGATYASSNCDQYEPQKGNNRNSWVQCQKNYYVSGLSDCGKSFLTFRPWFSGLCKMDADGKGGNIIDPSKLPGGLTAFVWAIVLNVIAILLQIVGYVSVGFIIWGGFQYILAQGEPAKLTTAQRTIINAIIGLVIAIFANIIINTVVHFITQGDGTQI